MVGAILLCPLAKPTLGKYARLFQMQVATQIAGVREYYGSHSDGTESRRAI